MCCCREFPARPPPKPSNLDKINPYGYKPPCNGRGWRNSCAFPAPRGRRFLTPAVASTHGCGGELRLENSWYAPKAGGRGASPTRHRPAPQGRAGGISVPFRRPFAKPRQASRARMAPGTPPAAPVRAGSSFWRPVRISQRMMGCGCGGREDRGGWRRQLCSRSIR